MLLSQSLYEISITACILGKKRSHRCREVHQLAEGHPAAEQQTQDLNPSLCILVSSDYYNKSPYTKQLQQQTIYFSQFWSVGSSGSICRQIWCLHKNHILVCRWPWSCIFTAGKEKSKLPPPSKGTNPIMRATPSWPNYLPTAPPPSITTQWNRFSTYELEGMH